MGSRGGSLRRRRYRCGLDYSWSWSWDTALGFHDVDTDFLILQATYMRQLLSRIRCYELLSTCKLYIRRDLQTNKTTCRVSGLALNAPKNRNTVTQ